MAIITGQQKGFSWSSVAASAVGGAVGNVVGGKLNTALANPSTGNLSFANNLFKGAVTNIASNVATQLTQIALDGKGKLSWTSVAVAGIYGIGSGLEANRRQEAQIAEQRAAQGNTTAVKAQNSAFTGERINVAGGVGRTDSLVLRVGGNQTEAQMDEDDRIAAEKQRAYDQKDLLSTNPSEGGLSIKAGAADSVKKQAESLNTGNAIEKSSSQTPVMNGAMSLLDANSPYYELNQNQYINANSASNLLINPATGLKEMRYTTDVRRAEQAAIIANAPRIQYRNYELRDGLKNPSITLEQARINFNQSLEKGIVSGTLTGAAYIAAPLLSIRNLAVLGGVSGFGYDTAGQYYLTKGFMTESYRPAQSLFAAATGAVAAPLGAKTGFLGNGLIGGTVGYANTEFNNFVYRENKDSAEAAFYGAAFGAGFSSLGNKTIKYLTPTTISSVPILLQRTNPYAVPAGNAVGSLSGYSSFIEINDKK